MNVQVRFRSFSFNRFKTISVGCQRSETLDKVEAQKITSDVLQNINNMGIDGDDDGDNGLVTNFNSLTQEELA